MNMNRDPEHHHLDEMEYAIKFTDTGEFVRDTHTNKVIIFSEPKDVLEFKSKLTRPVKIVERKKYVY